MHEEERTIAVLRRWIEASMQRSMRSLFRYARENNISMSQVGALFHIGHRGPLGVTDISERLGITSAAASQLLDRLVQQNLLERSEDPHDRRVRQISLTHSGQTLLMESLRAQQGWIADLVALCNQEEKEQIRAALELLLAKTQLLDAHEPSEQNV
jgi:DNA-binding MarR family transcriptional regulator